MCPNVNSSLPGICAITCSSDSGCRDGELCCRSSCSGRVCSTASNIPYYPVPRTCPVSSLITSIRNCSAVRSCRNNTDCAYNQACCSSECGRVCKATSNNYPCSSVLNEIRVAGVTPPPGYYTPQCDSNSGRFSATQCSTDGNCWCVDVNTGRPVSSYYPRGYRPSCQSECS